MKRFVKTLEPLSGLPNGFKEVEYLQSLNNNDFAIDTGITGHDGVESEVCVWFDSQVNNQCVLGSWSNASKRAWLCYTFGKKWYIGYVGTNQTSMDLVANQWNYVKTTIDTSGTQGRATLTVNDEVAGTVSYNKNWDNGVNLTLFRMNNDTGGDYYGSTCKVSLCKLWDNGVLVRHFVPCLDPAGVPCMYDKVQGKVYYNTASGTFQYGKQIIPVEYIENTGSSYIDTRYKPNSNTKVEAKFVMKENTTTFKWLFAARNENAAGNGFGFGAGTSGVITSDYNDRQADTAKLVSGTVYTVVKNKNICKYNNSVLTNTESTFSVNYNLPIYGLNNVGTMTSGTFAYAECYYFKIYDNDVLVKDFIPAIDENDTAYMFDRISHTLYANAGSGTFSYGDKVYKQRVRLIEERAELNGLPNSLKEVEYLKCNGAQYIDTGYNFNSNTDEITIVYQNESTAQHKWLFGSYETGKNIGISSGTLTAPTIWYNGAVNLIQDDEYYKGHILKYDSTGVSNDYVNKSAFKDIQGTWNIYLFALNNTGTSVNSYFGYGRIYMYQHKRNGVLIRDFVPCLDSNNKPGLFDRVSQKIFYNQGTGADFTSGKQIIPVEYLEGTGTQYIDTGTKVDANTKLTLDYQMTDITTTTNGIFGASAGQTLQFLTQTGQAKYVFQWTPNSIVYLGTKDTNRHTVIFDIPNTNLTVDSDTLSISSFTFDYPTGNIMLFANGHLSVRGRMKVYGGKIYENNVVIRDYIPVIDEDNTGYMFDKITHSLYENKGTGSFSYGEKVYKRRLRLASEPWYTKKYDLVNYIESTGTQYIDTGFIPNQDTKVELGAKITRDLSSGFPYFGSRTSSTSNGYSFQRYSNGKFGGQYGTKINNSTKAVDTDFHIILKDKNIIYMDGVIIETQDTATFTCPGNMYINAMNNNGTASVQDCNVAYYYMKIWDNGVLVRDFRPAKRKSDNKYGMLDMVTKQFYTNAGTGEFTGE